MSSVVSFYRLKPDQLSFEFRRSRTNAAFKSAHRTLIEHRDIAGLLASRSFAEAELVIWDDAIDETERAICLGEFERLGLIPPK